MTTDDFEPEMVDGQPAPGRWVAKSNLVTGSAEFRLTLRTGKRGGPADEQMLKQAAALAAYVARNHAEVMQLIFEEYLFTCESPEHLASTGVPQGLSVDQLPPFASPLTLYVVNWRGSLKSGLQCSPQWDPEHGLEYLFTGEGFERVEY